MAKALSDLRSSTRVYLDEIIAADWSVAQVDEGINYIYHEVVTAIIEVYEDYYVGTPAEFDSEEDKQEYGEDEGFPTDFFKVRRVEINYDTSNSNSSPSKALPITSDDVKRDLGNTTIGITTKRNPGYYLHGHGSHIKLGFIPIPDETGTDAIKLWYVYFPVDLSATTDEPDIPYPDRYCRLIPLGAAADLLRKGQQEEAAAARYRLEFEAGLEKMKQQLEDRKADDIKSVTDVVGLDLDFSGGY